VALKFDTVPAKHILTTVFLRDLPVGMELMPAYLPDFDVGRGYFRHFEDVIVRIVLMHAAH